MNGLLDKIRAAKSDPEIDPEIPDTIPPEIAEQYAQDPPPMEPPAGGGKGPRRPPAPRGSTVLRRKVAAELEAYARMAALGVAVRDPHCGMAMNDQAKAIADALAEIIARNPQLAEKFIQAGVIGDWAKLLMAVQPVVAAIYRHHIARSTDDQEGSRVDVAQYPAYRPGS